MSLIYLSVIITIIKGIPKSIPIVLNGMQEAILSMVSSNCQITQKEMAADIGLSQVAVKKSMKELLENNIIRREGSSRKGKWIIVNKNENQK